MTRRPLRILIAVVISTVAALALAVNGPAGATIISWTRQTTVNPAAQEVWLSAVSCGSASWCEGVGYYVNTQGHNVALAERWNGSTWARQSVPGVTGSTGMIFEAVSCVAASNCEAVGSFTKSNGNTVPLAERWNGLKWTVQTTPAPLRNIEWLNGVSCVRSVGCEAVGVSNNGATGISIAERWNGTRWLRQSTVNTASTSDVTLTAVSCVSASSCEAVGNYRTPASHLVGLAEHWNGVHWTSQPMVNPASTSVSFNAVSCATSTACEAVGGYENSLSQTVPLVERWNGSKWTRQTVSLGTTPGLTAVSCVATTICEAVGSGVAARWNGSTWSRQAMASPSTGGVFASLGVSCVINVGCESVGMYSPGAPKSMAERYRG